MAELDRVAGMVYNLCNVTVAKAQGFFVANQPNICHNVNQPAFGSSLAATVTGSATFAKAGLFISNENGGLLAKDRRRFQKGVKMCVLTFLSIAEHWFCVNSLLEKLNMGGVI